MVHRGQTDSQAELEAARIAGLSQAGLVCRLNSLAYLLDALAAQDTTVRAWWYEVVTHPRAAVIHDIRRLRDQYHRGTCLGF